MSIIYYYYYYSIFSWCEKKNVQSKVVSIPVKNQRHIATATKLHDNISTIPPMNTTNIYSDLKSTASNDLATKLKSARQ